MRTRRERREDRLARRLAWAAARDRRAADAFRAAQTIADGIPLGQPILVGHHSERRARRDQERIESGMRRGVESAKMASHHRARADGLAAELERSIYSDDADAAERLRERIAGLEAERERMKQVNVEVVRGPGWVERLAAAGAPLTEREREVLLDVARFQGYDRFPPYALRNIGGNIRRLKERLKHLRERR